MKPAIVLLSVLAMAGCSTPLAPQFVKEGTSADQEKADSYQCEREARTISSVDACTQIEMFGKCMAVKGYKPVAGSGKYCGS